jgi:DNA-3-methyladenine glycosylase I
MSAPSPILRSPSSTQRCPWAEAELQHDYHDTEWGVPSHDDRHLFEMLILEGAQAGLSWATILARRETYREAYGNFDAGVIARYDERHKASSATG